MKQNEQQNEILERALQYAAHGLAVFPCEERGKHPKYRDWQTNCTTDPEAIKTVWTRNPQFNIAIATGSKSGNLVVIDIDNHDNDGYSSLREWESVHGELPETVTVLTGSGGTHYYYKANKKVKGRTNVLPGVDIRAEGNLVIAPPSIHPNGQLYEWDAACDIEDMTIADANAR